MSKKKAIFRLLEKLYGQQSLIFLADWIEFYLCLGCCAQDGFKIHLIEDTVLETAEEGTLHVVLLSSLGLSKVYFLL